MVKDPLGNEPIEFYRDRKTEYKVQVFRTRNIETTHCETMEQALRTYTHKVQRCLKDEYVTLWQRETYERSWDTVMTTLPAQPNITRVIA